MQVPTRDRVPLDAAELFARIEACDLQTLLQVRVESSRRVLETCRHRDQFHWLMT